MEPGTLADARKREGGRAAPSPVTQWRTLDTPDFLAKLEAAKAAYANLVGANPPTDGGRRLTPSRSAPLPKGDWVEHTPPENPATCDHRADVLWLAHRLRISEHRVGDLRRQKKQLERRLRKALRKGKR